MIRIIGLIFVNTLLVVILSVSTPYFLTKANLVVLVDNMALEVIALSGYTLLLVSGNFDLSIDGVVALSGITAGLLMNNGVHWILALLAGLTVALFIGWSNGVIVSRFHINGLIATLTTWWICIGFSLGLTKALTPYNFPEGFQQLGQSRILGFRSLSFYALIAIVVLSIVLHYTKLGAHIYINGDNKNTAELMGINTIQLGTKMYLLVGFLAGVIGIMTASRLNAASPMAVDGMTLRVIAAAVIGGTALNGGKGSIIGGVLGLCIMHILGNGIIQFGASPYWQKAILGGILLTAVLSERLNFSFRRV